MKDSKFKKRIHIFYSWIGSCFLNILIALVGYFQEYDKLPEFRDIIISSTLMAPFAKPIAFGGLLSLLDPFSQGRSWHIAFILYWPAVIGFLIAAMRTRLIWPFIISALIGAAGSLQWYIIGIGLFYI
jgi:hypothetical protein